MDGLSARAPAPSSSLPLSIALDATLWDEPTTGIGLYTRCLTEALEKEGVWVNRLGARRSGEHPRGRRGRTAFLLREVPKLLRAGEEPIFHAVCNFNLPLFRIAGKRMVLTVHDLIPDLLPGSSSFAYRWQFRLWLRRSLQLADRVVCDSERSRQDLLERFGADPRRVETVPLGVDHVLAVPAPAPEGLKRLERLQLPERFVLYAGAMEARKNVELLLGAAARLAAQARPITVVLAGQRAFGAEGIDRRVAQAKADGVDVRAVGYQPAPEFYALMRRASAFVFPSRYEGFGLPPLEAMALGIPTVVSNAASLPEVCGEGAQQVGPDDVEGMAAALTRLLDSEAERARWAERGAKWAAQFTWQRSARRMVEIYRSML